MMTSALRAAAIKNGRDVILTVWHKFRRLSDFYDQPIIWKRVTGPWIICNNVNLFAKENSPGKKQAGAEL